MTDKIDFKTLFDRAVKEWPREIDLGTLHKSNPSDTKYAVAGLGALSDEISESHIGSLEEILMRGIHYAIFIQLHKLAADCKMMEVAYLREESVQAVFEERLTPSWGGEDLGWTPEDYKLVKMYFDQTGGKRP